MSYVSMPYPKAVARLLLSSLPRSTTSGLLRLGAVAALALTLTTCGERSAGATGATESSVKAGAQTHWIAGYVTGLNAGASVTLLNNGANANPVPTNGMFLFSSTLSTGATYAVTVGSQPPHQTCAVDNGTGTVGSSNVTNITVTCAANPQFAYVANSGSDTVSAYSINTRTGALTPVPGSPFAAVGGPKSVTVNPAGTFAYVANSGFGIPDGFVSAYSINATTGALTPVPGSPFTAGIYPRSVKVNYAGTFAYVANSGDSTVSAYSINTRTGALTPVPGSPFTAGSHPTSVTVNPAGTFAYVANEGNNVSAYSINARTGALTPVAGSPFVAGIEPESVTVNPTGTFAYVANSGSGTVSGYSIDASTGALTPVAGSPFAAGIEPESVTVNPAGTFAYVANYEGTVSAYSINTSTGALTPVPGSPFAAGRGPNSVTVNPAGTFAYVAKFGAGLTDGTVMAYSINTSTGALTPVPGNPFAAGIEPFFITVTQP